MKVGQFFGHSCFKIETRTRLSLLTKVRCAFNDSSDDDASMIWLTTKFRIPKESQSENAVEREISYATLTLVSWQNLPSCCDHIVQYLQS